MISPCSTVCGALLWAKWEHCGEMQKSVFVCVCVCAHYMSLCAIRDTYQRLLLSCLSACGLLFVSPASSASQMPLDLRRLGPAAPGSGGTAAQCATQGPEELSSYWLFTLCTLITEVYVLISFFLTGHLCSGQVPEGLSLVWSKCSPKDYFKKHVFFLQGWVKLYLSQVKWKEKCR